MQRILLTAGFALLGCVGCHHRDKRSGCDTCAPGVYPAPTGRSGGSLGEPVPPPVRLAPTEIPTTPAPTDDRNYRAPTDANRLPPADIPLGRTDPARTTATLGEPLPPAGLKLPTAADTPPATDSLPPRQRSAATPTPTPSPNPTTPTTSRAFREPVPGRDGVTTGGAIPTGGYQRLRDDGVRTVVYFHDPAVAPADLADARAAATSADLKFVPVAVSPDNLKDALTVFARAITDATSKPTHVTDASGVRAGSLWYLVFRTVEQRPDEVARIRATPLGLPDPSTADGQLYWPGICAALR